MKFLDILESVLKEDSRFIADDGRLLKTEVYNACMAFDENLLSLLMKNGDTKSHFFKEVNNALVFDKIKFTWVLESREFLPDSYTMYKNKIGLTNGSGEFISQSDDVSLVWPYKDCILEGGQTKDDQKRDEIFYNETLAPDEVNRLLYPKVFTNAKRYSKGGTEDITQFDENDNLIIKGNNLLALSSLLKRYEGKVKCICIDPPYNKETDEFNYNDNFNHSTWLTFIKTRIEMSYKILEKNGTLFVFCDDSEHAYLKVLLDEIFSRERYIQTIVWRNSDNSNNDAKQFSQDHNYILVYSKNALWESFKLERTDNQSKHYKNPDNDPRGAWFDGNPLNSPNPRKNLMYNLVSPNGTIIPSPPNGWRWDKKEMKNRMETGEIKYNEKQTNILRRTYLNEQKGLPPSSLWDIADEFLWLDIDETGHTRQAKYEQKKLFEEIVASEQFSTPKPEKVIKRILKISTSPADITLDFFNGSGTTSAVAHKMGRRYIGVEQMDYINTITVPRLEKVIDGEQGGISKDVDWQGGGSFVYCELKELNETFVEQIQNAKTDKELTVIKASLLETGYISHKVDIKEISKEDNDYNDLSFENKQKFLLELIDKNKLYVNYCDIEDEDMQVSEAEKSFTNSFYDIRGE